MTIEPVTMEELMLADRLCNWETTRKGFNWRYLGDACIDRAKRVLIDGQSTRQVAEADGINLYYLQSQIRKAHVAVLKLRRGECRKV